MSITLNAAQQYCSWLSKKTGRKYRLPTIEEWQYAARAGSDKDELSPAELQKVAWYWDNSDSKTHPVARLAPNAFGLHDMLGNIAEWVTLPDGEGVVCGGSYDDEAGDVRLDAAKPYNPAWQTADPQDPKSTWWLSDGPMVGLRVVCDP